MFTLKAIKKYTYFLSMFKHSYVFCLDFILPKSFLDSSAKRIKLDQQSVKSNLLEAFSKENAFKEGLNADDNTSFIRQRVFHRPLLGHDMLSVTNTDGDRVFLKLIPEDKQKNKVRSYIKISIFQL